MKDLFKRMVLAVFSCLLLCGYTGNVRKGRQLYTDCASCHGARAEGMKSMKAPALAGQKGYYLKSSIDDFKKGLRGSHKKDTGGKSMRRMVKLLKSDKQIADIIAYLQSLEPVSAKAKLGGDTGRGEELFSSCVECHGPKGEGVEDQRTPRIAGLADWYTYAQLKHFRDGVRGDSKDPLEKKMIESVTTLSNKDLKNIATYLTTLGK